MNSLCVGKDFSEMMQSSKQKKNLMYWILSKFKFVDYQSTILRK